MRKFLSVVTWLSALWLLTLLAIYSQAGVGLLGLYFFVSGAGILTLSFLVALVSSREVRMRSLRSLLVLPAFVLTAILLVVFVAPPANPFFRLRFWFSQSAMTAFARDALLGANVPVPSKLGLYPVLSTEVIKAQVRIITTDCGLVDRCGFVYSENTAPTRVYEDRFTPLGKGWYHVLQGF